MTLALQQSATALGPNVQASFLATGGTEPYAFTVLPGGAGGSIDPVTGIYHAPDHFNSDPSQVIDTIQVTDSALPSPATATAQILVASPLLLFCDVLQHELSLTQDHIYLWDQKLFQPTDADLYVAVAVAECKPFGNSNRNVNGQSVQYVSMWARLTIDAISRGPSARDRKEEIILALNSNYAQQQQDANSFYISKVPANGGFKNLSTVDGAAIPYRFQISVALQYMSTKQAAQSYFDSGFVPSVITNP